jgi:hypothetical protein
VDPRAGFIVFGKDRETHVLAIVNKHKAIDQSESDRKVRKAARVAATHVDFGDVVSTRGDALRDPLKINLYVVGSKVDEVDPEAPRTSQTYQAQCAPASQRRFDAECFAGVHTVARNVNSRSASTQSGCHVPPRQDIRIDD